MVQPLHIKNARVWDSETGAVERDLYTTDVVVDKPHANAIEVDLDGYTIFPGLINAHDHLELNHYPRTKFREVYNNAHEWGEDVNKRLNDEPFKTLRAYPLKDRLFIGGLKNLLCGATTVAHHGPPHRPMYHQDFPVRVLKNYGWAHSLHFNTEAEIVASYRKTPKEWPWFIHLAEGTDDVAASEYQRLKDIGCIGENTVIVHGVGMTREDVVNAHVTTIEFLGHGSQVPIIWCPTTNIYLLGKTGHPRMGWNTQMLLGSDSRLTADGDLLDEMRFVSELDVKEAASVAVGCTTKTQYRWAAYLRDRIQPIRSTRVADFIAIRNSEKAAWSLCHSKRSDIGVVIRDGIPQIGDPDVMAKFSYIETVRATVDGVPKAIHIDLARRIQKCTLKESGLELVETPKKRFFLF